MNTPIAQWSIVVEALSTVVIALLAVIQARYLLLTYRVYRLATRPMLYAWLRDKKESPGMKLENAGTGVAWNGKVVITALDTSARTEFHFPPLYPRSGCEFPPHGLHQQLFDPLLDRRIRVEISYDDEERRGRTYHWQMEAALPVEWLHQHEEAPRS
ncbi:MAG: hypothetical protein HY681_07905 [Chloroflexi bacterium]|nr:hypothetical protein [Chloroflexota bacterium]